MKKTVIFLISMVICSSAVISQELVKTIKNAHKLGVNGVAISGDGAIIVSGGSDKYTHIWGSVEGTKIQKPSRNIYSVMDVDISNDGRLVVSVGVTKTVDVWDTETKKYSGIYKGHSGTITCVKFSDNEKYLATGAKDKTIMIWDIATGERKYTLKHDGDVNSLAFDRSGEYIVSAGDKLYVWKTSGGQLYKSIEAGEKDVRCVDVDPDRNVIAYSKGNDIILMGFESFETTASLSGHTKQINKLKFSPDGKFLFSCSDDYQLIIWDVATGQKKISFEAHERPVTCMDVSSNGLYLVTGSDDDNIHLYDISALGIGTGIVADVKDVFLKSEEKDVDFNESDVLTRGGGDPLKGLNVSSAKKEMEIGDYYALIIGIDNYSGTWNKLENAVNDAKAVESLLKSKYKFDHFKVLYNDQATRSNIIKEMEWLVSTVKEKDNVFIYYSGHGEFKDELNKGYWVPADAKSKSTSEYISNNDIQTFLGGIKSKHTLLVADACFSGDIFRGNTLSVPYENSDKYYTKVHDLVSRQAMSSGGIEPVMDGGRDGHSVFAYYLIKSLTGNTNKYFDASELYSNIKIPVTNNSDQSPKFQPIKNTGDEGGQFIFIKK